jgi:hypothetical protein
LEGSVEEARVSKVFQPYPTRKYGPRPHPIRDGVMTGGQEGKGGEGGGGRGGGRRGGAVAGRFEVALRVGGEWGR